MFRKVLIANDGSEGAFKALDAALSLARSHKAQLHMICVEEIQWVPATREEVIGDKELAARKPSRPSSSVSLIQAHAVLPDMGGGACDGIGTIRDGRVLSEGKEGRTRKVHKSRSLRNANHHCSGVL